MSKLVISDYQQAILADLDDNRVIVEINYKGNLEYEIATISIGCPHGYVRPKRIRKQTAWELISNNLIKEAPPIWPETTNVKIYRKVQ